MLWFSTCPGLLSTGQGSTKLAKQLPIQNRITREVLLSYLLVDINRAIWQEELVGRSDCALELVSLNKTTELGVNLSSYYIWLHNKALENSEA